MNHRITLFARGRLAITIAFALVATLAVLVGPTPGHFDVAEAAPIAAPTSPMPECVIDESGNVGLGCTPDGEGVAATVGGSFSAGGTFTVTNSGVGLSACAFYTDAGCHYELYRPTFLRCVYVEAGDAENVRRCPNLSTAGFVAPTRVGSCTARFGNTWMYGGPKFDPSTHYVARAARAAECEYNVPNNPIDNLYGPSFYLVSTSVRECVDVVTGRCTDGRGTSRTVSEYAWLPVEGTLAPRAFFTPEQIGNSLGFNMVNHSVPFDGPTTYEWDLGDGSPVVTTKDPSHTYPTLGRYRVQLTMRGSEEGEVLTAVEYVDIEAPDLRITVANPNAEFGPGEDGNRYDIGDEIDLRVHLTVTDGVGDLRLAAPVADLVTLPEQFVLVNDPVEPTPKTYEVGDEDEFLVRVRAVKPGLATIRSTWNANGIDGNPAGPWSGSFDNKVTGLQVEILPDPDSFKREDSDGDGDIDADDNHVDVEIKVTNVTDAPITDVTKGEVVVTSKTDDLLAQFLLVSSPVDDPGTPTIDEGDFGDLAPQESKSLTWTYGAEEALHVDVSMLVTGNADGATVTSSGEAAVKAFDNVVLEAEIAVGSNPSYNSGKAIRFDGTFTNVTDRPEAEEELDISFAAVPVISAASSSGSTELPLNGAGGYFGESGGRTPDGVAVFELAPGASLTHRAIVETLQTDLRTGFTVEYKVVASIKNVGESGDVTWQELDELEIDVVDKGEFSPDHTVTLGAVAPEREERNFFSCDPEVLWTAEYIGCKLVRGVETAARGLGDLMQLGWQLTRGTVAAYGYLLGTTFEMLMQDEAGRAAIAEEVTRELLEMANLGYTVLSGVDSEQIALLVPQMLDRGFTRIHNAWCGRTPQQQNEEPQPCNGDVEVFMGELSEIAGENIDMVFEALVAARSLAKVSKALAGGDGDSASVISRLWAQRDEKALARAQEVIDSKGSAALPGARALPAGVDVTDAKQIWRDSYGLSERQFTAIRILTKKYGINITFRSRAPGSIRLIDSKVALPKPQGIKTKGVNEIDVEFLGYHSDYADKVIHMEPPIPLQQTYEGVREAAEAYALDVVQRKRPNLSPSSPEFKDLVGQVKERVITRHDEWGELSVEYTNALKPNKLGEPTGVKVDFDGDFNAAPGERLRYEKNRPIELRPGRGGPDAGNRSVYEVKLQAPPGHSRAGEFLDVTGDVDFLAILKPDGTVLGANGDPAELAKRLQIYELMRAEPIGMQHGESFTIGVSDKVRAKYLNDGVDAPGGETTLTVTPEQRVITTYFDDDLSTLDLGDFTLSEAGKATAFFRGVFTEIGSPDRPWTRELIDQVVRSWKKVKLTAVLFDVSLLDQFVVELAGRVENLFDRSGEVVRPDGAGGLEQYEPGDDPASRVRPEASGIGSPDRAVVPATDTTLVELESILDGLAAQGFDPDPPGALGGRWVPVDVDEVVSGGSLSLAPFAYLATGAVAGESTIVVSTREQLRIPDSSPWFEVGDQIVLDPGGSYEETATIQALSPLTLASALQYTHDALTTVIMVPEQPKAQPDPDPTPDPTPDPDPDPTPVPDPVVPVEVSLSPLTPVRVFESRVGERTVDGVLEGGGRLPAGSVTAVQIAGRGGVASGAAAVAVNVTAIRPSGVGYVTLFPCGGEQPLTSSLNYGAGGVAGNSGIVKLNSDGELCVFTFAESDLVIDVNAWLAEAPSFESLTPARLAETRIGEKTVDGEAQELGRLGAGSVTTVQVAGRGGVASGADAVALNVTAIRPGGVGYVTLYPCDEERPTTSSLNYSAGGAVGNSAVVSLSATGTLCVFTFVDTDLVLDVNAWLADDASFDPLVPARFFDSRSGQETVDGQASGEGRLGAMSVTTIPVAGRGGVPAGASAVALNVTAVRPAGVGYITLFPCDGDQPLTSSLNYAAGGAVGNSGVVKLSASGTVCAYTQADTDLVIDVNAAWTN